MTEKQIPKNRKSIFPFGIFLLVFTVQLCVSAGLTGYFTYSYVKNELEKTTDYIKNQYSSAASSLADIASLSYDPKKPGKVSSLFKGRLDGLSAAEALFVLNDGTIISSIDSEPVRAAKGNILNDRIYFNIDLILACSKEGKAGTLFTDYNLITGKPAFTPKIRNYISQYMYSGIKSTAWIASRAVYNRGEPVGTVSLIISKKQISDYLMEQIPVLKRNLILCASGSALVALLLSIFVFIRYRSIRKRSAFIATDELPEIKTPAAEHEAEPVPVPAHEIFRPVPREAREVRIIEKPDGSITIELDRLRLEDSDESGCAEPVPHGSLVSRRDRNGKQEKKVKDPIPAGRKIERI